MIMDQPSPAEALAAQRARDEEYDAKIRAMTEAHLAKRKAARAAREEQAAAVLLAAGFPPSVRDSQDAVVSPGWTVRASTDGVFVGSDPLMFAEGQIETLRSATSSQEWLRSADMMDGLRFTGVREQLAAYRRALVDAGWEVRLLDSQSVWIIKLYAEFVPQEAYRGSELID